MEESPPPFIVFRSPARTPDSPYDRALGLVSIVHEIVETATTRFYLKDRLDRLTTTLVFELRRAATEPSSVRWKNLRLARVAATDIATILDIFTHQRAASADLIMKAQRIVTDLMALL